MRRAPFIVLLSTFVLTAPAFAQAPADSVVDRAPASIDSAKAPVPERDVFDLLDQYVFKKRIEPELGGQTSRGLHWALLPSFSYNPVYGVALGLSLSGAGQRGLGTDRFSNISISGNYSTTKQLQLQARGDVFSAGGNYLLKADLRYLDTDRTTWGLGPYETTQEEYPMSFTLWRFYATMFRRVSGPVFLGLGYHWDEYVDIVDARAVEGEETPFTRYSGGAPQRTATAGISINLLGDTRDNLVNATSGYYLNWTFRSNLKDLGADDDWQEMWAEMRVYPHVPVKSGNVLAFWVYAWMTFGDAPYLSLPTNGWDMYGRGARGYLQGRIRGQNQVYSECEYRFSLSRDGLFGAVVFVNIISTTKDEVETFGSPDLGAGAGLRIKFNKDSDTNLIIDHGWGQGGSNVWFLGMTETF